MEMNREQHAAIKTALFIDFDNVYLSLERVDRRSAKTFATDPLRWLAWIESGMQDNDNSPSNQKRSVLIRRCYLNPTGFSQFRPYFTRGAFEVIDCPPLTGGGKNSADIRMVMDILDVLEHKTYFEEFIILSGDADFTPVITRLRAHNRRTAVFSPDLVAEAYKSACDILITDYKFIESGLGLGTPVENEAIRMPVSTTPIKNRLLDDMASALYEQARSVGDIQGNQLPSIYRQFDEFRRSSSWLGYGTLRGLTQSVVARRNELVIMDGDELVVSARMISTSPTKPEKVSSIATQDKKANVVEFVRTLVSQSATPLAMATAASKIMSTPSLRPEGDDWFGSNSFKDFLLNVKDRGFELITAAGTPGFLYDPSRHTVPRPEDDRLKGLSPLLVDLMRRLRQVIGVPLITPSGYKTVFYAISKIFRGYSTREEKESFNISSAATTIRDQCDEHGESVSKMNSMFILKAVLFARRSSIENFATSNEPKDIATAFRDSVIDMCASAQMTLSSEEQILLATWLIGTDDILPNG